MSFFFSKNFVFVKRTFRYIFSVPACASHSIFILAKGIKLSPLFQFYCWLFMLGCWLVLRIVLWHFICIFSRSVMAAWYKYPCPCVHEFYVLVDSPASTNIQNGAGGAAMIGERAPNSSVAQCGENVSRRLAFKVSRIISRSGKYFFPIPTSHNATPKTPKHRRKSVKQFSSVSCFKLCAFGLFSLCTGVLFAECVWFGFLFCVLVQCTKWTRTRCRSSHAGWLPLWGNHFFAADSINSI